MWHEFKINFNRRKSSWKQTERNKIGSNLNCFKTFKFYFTLILIACMFHVFHTIKRYECELQTLRKKEGRKTLTQLIGLQFL